MLIIGRKELAKSEVEVSGVSFPQHGPDLGVENVINDTVLTEAQLSTSI